MNTTRMDRYNLLGNPIAHSQSPLIHARFAELTGQSLQYQPLLTPLDGFAATLTQLAQAANTLVLDGGAVHADNTDGVGLVNDIQNNAGVALAGRDLLLIGAGGAGAAGMKVVQP